MKKLLAIVLLFAVLLSCCACGAKEEKKEFSMEDMQSPEAKFGHIDQTKPIDGFYKLWNAEGIQFMMENPQGMFEILCDIDMEGAVLHPMAECSCTVKYHKKIMSN